MNFPSALLGDLVTYLRRGRTPRYADAGSTRIINQRCVRWHGVDVGPARTLLDEDLEKWQAAAFLRAADVLVNSTGEGTIGRAAVWPPGIDGFVTDSHVTVIRTKANVLEPWWLRYWLESPDGQLFVASAKTGATKQTELGTGRLKTAKVPVPPIGEQRRIVGRIHSAFERLDEVRALRGHTRKEAAAVFPSLLAERFQALAEGQPVATIDDVTLETRYGTSRRCTRDPGGIPVLRIPNVAGGGIDFDDLKFCDQLSDSELTKLLLQDGDLLIVRTNGSRALVGRCAVFHDPGRGYAYASYLIRIRTNPEKVHPQFLAFFLESTMGRDAISERRRTSAGQYNINSTNLRTIPFPCPTLDLQQDLVDEMLHHRRVVNEVIAKHSSMEQQDQALRQAVLRKAFAGEL